MARNITETMAEELVFVKLKTKSLSLSEEVGVADEDKNFLYVALGFIVENMLLTTITMLVHLFMMCNGSC